MVVEPWLHKMGNNLKKPLLLHQTSTKKKDPFPKIVKLTIGILSFEVANVMSKLVQLHKSLCNEEVSKLRNDVVKLEGVKKLVSLDESCLIELAYCEKLNDLDRFAKVVSRLGKKCNEPHLKGFEHVFGDVINGKIDVGELGFLVKDMEVMVRKMEKYVCATSNLYSEMEVLNELEKNVESRGRFEQEVRWQRQTVSHLKDVSLWNLTYDKVVELLARTVCTLYARICVAFGNVDLVLNRSVVSGSLTFVKSSGKVEHLVSLSRSISRHKSLPVEKGAKIPPNFRSQLSFRKCEIDLLQFPQDFVLPRAPSSEMLFTKCLSFSSSASKVDVDVNDNIDLKSEHSIHLRCLNQSQLGAPFSGEQMQQNYSVNALYFGPKSRLAKHTTPSTVGGSALSLHYANLVIVIEKFLRYPHLVGEQARDELYHMLPQSLRKSLEINLKSHYENFGIYDGAVARDWKETLDGVLRWLTPLAHNMIRWQSEHNVEQQQNVSRTKILLVQTLHFADREKVEDAVCELLLGLNFICRYEHQKSALLDCASSFDFGDWMEWQSQGGDSFLN